jgi:predicted DNA-binding protein
MPTFTMRLPDEDYEALQAMALLTGRPMAELVRDAVADSLTKFASSKDLREHYEQELRVREQAVELLRQRLLAGKRNDTNDATVAVGADRQRVPASA